MKSIERQRNFIDFTLSSLLRRKWKNAALILVYALVVFMISSVMLFANAIRNEARALLQEAPDMIVQRTVAGRHDLIPLSHMQETKADPRRPLGNGSTLGLLLSSGVSSQLYPDGT